MKIKGLIFDLDGVICDTATYHFQAWRQLAQHLGFDLTEEQNESLKGLSRKKSILKLIEIGGISLSEEEIERYMALKNEWYKELISHMKEEETLPGAKNFLETCKRYGYLLALGSASKNAQRIIETLNLTHYFKAIIDGTKVSASKPDPEVFLKGAKELGLAPQECIVFEDATSGVQAALNGGFHCIGIGSPETLSKAHLVVDGLHALSEEKLNSFIESL